MEVHMLVVVLFTVMVSSEEVKKNLTGTVGGSITLPEPVEDGFLLFQRKIIASVTNRQIKIFHKTYKDKVLWNNNNRGLFTITRLQKNNSGIYSIQNDTEETVISYNLTVYDPVSTPEVKAVNVSSESCTLLCSVEKTEETTLLWYKDEQMLDQSSSSLSLPLNVLKKDFSSSYRCVAANPADQKTSTANMTACGAENEPNTPNNGKRQYLAAVLIPIVLLTVILVVLCKWECSDKNKKTTTHQQSSKSQRAEETTVVLYKVQQMLNRSSSSLSYRCAAANPAD